MNLTIKTKESAALEMSKKIFSPKFEGYLAECSDLIIEAYEKLYKKDAEKAIETGIDHSFLTKKSNLSLEGVFQKKGDAYPKSTKIMWINQDFYNIRDSENFFAEGYNEVKKVNYKTKESLVFPSAFFGCISVDGNKNKEEKYIFDKIQKLNEKLKIIIMEAKKYKAEVSQVLDPIKTLKQLEERFPAAVVFFPKPEPKPTQIIPVELINNLTKKIQEVK